MDVSATSYVASDGRCDVSRISSVSEQTIRHDNSMLDGSSVLQSTFAFPLHSTVIHDFTLTNLDSHTPNLNINLDSGLSHTDSSSSSTDRSDVSESSTFHSESLSTTSVFGRLKSKLKRRLSGATDKSEQQRVKVNRSYSARTAEKRMLTSSPRRDDVTVCENSERRRRRVLDTKTWLSEHTDFDVSTSTRDDVTVELGDVSDCNSSCLSLDVDDCDFDTTYQEQQATSSLTDAHPHATTSVTQNIHDVIGKYLWSGDSRNASGSASGSEAGSGSCSVCSISHLRRQHGCSNLSRFTDDSDSRSPEGASVVTSSSSGSSNRKTRTPIHDAVMRPHCSEKRMPPEGCEAGQSSGRPTQPLASMPLNNRVTTKPPPFSCQESREKFLTYRNKLTPEKVASNRRVRTRAHNKTTRQPRGASPYRRGGSADKENSHPHSVLESRSKHKKSRRSNKANASLQLLAGCLNVTSARSNQMQASSRRLSDVSDLRSRRRPEVREETRQRVDKRPNFKAHARSERVPTPRRVSDVTDLRRRHHNNLHELKRRSNFAALNCS